MSNTAHPVIWFADLDTTLPGLDTDSRQIAELVQAKFPLSPGFLVTDQAYFTFFHETKLDHKVSQILSTIAIDRPESLMQGEHLIARLFEEAELSEALQTELLKAFAKLGDKAILKLHATGKQPVKHKTLYAHTGKQLIRHVKTSWAAMFTSSALWQRHHQEIDHLTTGAVLLVERHLPSHKAGIAVTIEKQTHAKDKITIITNKQDQYILSKKNLTLLDRHLKHEADNLKLTHDELLEIATVTRNLEKHLYFPQEISWTYPNDQLYITDIKPMSTLRETQIEPRRKISIARGTSITPTIGTGITKIVHIPSDLLAANGQHILIVKEAKAQDFQQLKKAKGIISESGHPHTEIATLLRNHGIPTIFNIKDATKNFKNGHLITVHGDKGEIYRGGF